MEKITEETSLYRVIDKVVPDENRNEFFERINGKEPLKIKFGTDPTGTDLHFGHAVNLWAMRSLQEMGHKVDLIIGDVTAKIGDPTGRNAERPQLDQETITKNTELFFAQIFKILKQDPKVFQIHHNSEWFNAMSAVKFIDSILRRVTISKLLERKDFKERMEFNLPIHAHEIVYQLLQGYDSVHLGSHMAICGDDQLTNELMGRQLQQAFGQEPQYILTTKITPGIDGGKKQSKTLGNYIGLNHSPEEQFRRIMSIPDVLMESYFNIYTDLPTSQIQSLLTQYRKSDQRTLKMILAESMLSRYHDENTIGQAKNSYERSAQGEDPEDIPTVHIQKEDLDLVDFAKANLGMSKTQFLNLIRSGAVRVDNIKLGETDLKDRSFIIRLSPAKRLVLRYGKNKWVAIVVDKG